MTTTTLRVLAATLVCVSTLANDRDRFNYDTTTPRGGDIYDYGPEEWANLDCQGGSNIDNCVSYSMLRLPGIILSASFLTYYFFSRKSWDIETSGSWRADGISTSIRVRIVS